MNLEEAAKFAFIGLHPSDDITPQPRKRANVWRMEGYPECIKVDGCRPPQKRAAIRIKRTGVYAAGNRGAAWVSDCVSWSSGYDMALISRSAVKEDDWITRSFRSSVQSRTPRNRFRSFKKRAFK